MSSFPGMRAYTTTTLYPALASTGKWPLRSHPCSRRTRLETMFRKPLSLNQTHMRPGTQEMDNAHLQARDGADNIQTINLAKSSPKTWTC